MLLTLIGLLGYYICNLLSLVTAVKRRGDIRSGIMVVRLSGKQKVRGSSPAKGYLFLRSVGIPSRYLVLVMNHNIKLLQVCSKHNSSMFLIIFSLLTDIVQRTFCQTFNVLFKQFRTSIYNRYLYPRKYNYIVSISFLKFLSIL